MDFERRRGWDVEERRRLELKQRRRLAWRRRLPVREALMRLRT